MTNIFVRGGRITLRGYLRAGEPVLALGITRDSARPWWAFWRKIEGGSVVVEMPLVAAQTFLYERGLLEALEGVGLIRQIAPGVVMGLDRARAWISADDITLEMTRDELIRALAMMSQATSSLGAEAWTARLKEAMNL